MLFTKDDIHPTHRQANWKPLHFELHVRYLRYKQYNCRNWRVKHVAIYLILHFWVDKVSPVWVFQA